MKKVEIVILSNDISDKVATVIITDMVGKQSFWSIDEVQIESIHGWMNSLTRLKNNE